MTTTKATMIAVTKHETHSYYVIILTFSPVRSRVQNDVMYIVLVM